MSSVRLVASGAVLAGILIAAPVHAQEMFIYPSKGQSAAQQDKDKYECYNWAKGQTGFDPIRYGFVS